jgi:hypothetical protein
MGVADDIDTLVGQLNGLFAAYATAVRNPSGS